MAAIYLDRFRSEVSEISKQNSVGLIAKHPVTVQTIPDSVLKAAVSNLESFEVLALLAGELARVGLPWGGRRNILVIPRSPFRKSNTEEMRVYEDSSFLFAKRRERAYYSQRVCTTCAVSSREVKSSTSVLTRSF